jgi:hypothetical protein
MSFKTFRRDPLLTIANHKWSLVLTYFATMLLGAVGYWLIEGVTFIQAFYFAVVAGTSTGFGDITPDTEAGMIFVTLYLLWAIPVMLSLVTAFIVSMLRQDPNVFTDEEQKSILRDLSDTKADVAEIRMFLMTLAGDKRNREGVL